MKSPRDPRDMWKKPENAGANSDSEVEEIVTKVVQQGDFEIFESDAPDVDYEELNENEAASINPKRDHPNMAIDIVLG